MGSFLQDTPGKVVRRVAGVKVITLVMCWAGESSSLPQYIHWTQTSHPQCVLKANSGQNKPLMMVTITFDRA